MAKPDKTKTARPNNTERNKRLISERLAREQAKKLARETVPRGTARAKRRRLEFLGMEATS